MLKIIADNAIPFVERFFSRIGEVNLVDGRKIFAETIKGADVLVCRTVTKVNAQLLQNSAICIVASPTSGFDHVDLNYLQQQSITFVSAPGSNARSVAEYVLSALFVLADQNAFDLTDKTVGIIGCGKVGSEVRDFFQAIGITSQVYDPILQESSDSNDYCELADIQAADIITLHVPLTTDGAYPTLRMLDARFFHDLKEDVILINTARGQVLDETDFKKFLLLNPQAMAVVDVWENEPAIDAALLLRADIATSHIAGYSMDGKLRATQMVFDKVCESLNINNDYEGQQTIFPMDRSREISLSHDQKDIDAISMAVLASYDVRSDAAALRRILEDNVEDRSSYFDDLRNNYPIRREFSSLGIALTKEAKSLRQMLLTLGFRLTDAI
ncbi:MAG: erythronate-4-phosphate dehydrogenase [Gammaproteobacteria bacterium]|jgi:erythronate-4-phosphate dehydrogenase